ncbi:peroxidase 41-like [Coffea eugenioides]|uniref:peroxidase 41-like n=1 Tax=Coffea eugenioides TaxID=49369 RepID=UPI000F613642|nr:peroxidase 41-like [Coffea eugenioides]
MFQHPVIESSGFHGQPKTLLSSPCMHESALTLDYYAKTCPRFEDILRDVTQAKQAQSPTTAAATLRVFFHDCMVGGCDASVLVKPTAFNKTEMDADINHSLAGDAFDLIARAKTAIELSCPGVVSCSDILAVATRDLVSITGGPFYNVSLGRLDGLVSQASQVDGNLARSNASADTMINIFAAKNFTIPEMVALIGGGHTIGFAHCSEFADRIFGPKVDPSINPKLVEGLKKTCANYTTNEGLSAFLDVMSPGVFDNRLFKNLQNGLGVLASDQVLFSDPRTRPLVDKYAQDSQAFFDDFARAMEKVSIYGVKTGKEGEVRKRCDVLNSA